MLDGLNWKEIRRHYETRKLVHKDLVSLQRQRKQKDLVELLLGMSNPVGNYSAHEHNLGSRILTRNQNPYRQVWNLAGQLTSATSGLDVPRLIKNAAISFLAISVGSEACCMLNPKVCWVTNVRSVWSHMAFENDSIDAANEALVLYRQGNPDSDMLYDNWMDPFHSELPRTLQSIEHEGARRAKADGVKPGSSKYLWIDAIISAFYAQHHSA